MTQLVIPSLERVATPAHLFVHRLRAENTAIKSGCSESEALRRGQEWLRQR